MFYLFPSRNDRVEELIKLWAMIMEFQVTQLMRNNIVNAFFRRLDSISKKGPNCFSLPMAFIGLIPFKRSVRRERSD